MGRPLVLCTHLSSRLVGDVRAERRLALERALSSASPPPEVATDANAGEQQCDEQSSAARHADDEADRESHVVLRARRCVNGEFVWIQLNKFIEYYKNAISRGQKRALLSGRKHNLEYEYNNFMTIVVFL